MAYDENGYWYDDPMDYIPTVDQSMQYQDQGMNPEALYLANPDLAWQYTFAEGKDNSPFGYNTLDYSNAGTEVANTPDVLSIPLDIQKRIDATPLESITPEVPKTAETDTKSEALKKEVSPVAGGLYKVVDEKGKITYTNDPALTGMPMPEYNKKPAEVEGAKIDKLNAEVQTPSIENAKERMEAIRSEEDPIKKSRLLHDYIADSSVEIAKLKQQADEQLNNKLGIPKLIKAYQESTAKDFELMKQGRQFKGGRSDETTSILMQLNQADKQYKLEYQSLKQIPAIEARTTALKLFAQEQEKEIEYRQKIGIRRADKEEAKQETMNAWKAQIGPGQLAAIKIMYPMLGNPNASDDKRMDAFYTDIHDPKLSAVDKKQKQETLSLSDRPDMLLGSALSGNKYSRDVFLAQESQKTGDSNKAVADFKTLDAIVNNPSSYKQLRIASIDPNAKHKEATIKDLETTIDKMVTNGKAWEASKPQRIKEAINYLSAENIKRMIGDVTSWPGLNNDPEAGPIIKELQRTSNSRAINLDSFLAEFIGKADPTLLSKRADLINQYGNDVILANNQGLLGQIPADVLKGKISTKIAVARSVGAAQSTLNREFWHGPTPLTFGWGR